MVVEKLITVREAIKSPLHVFIITGIVSVICLSISVLVFEESVGLFTTYWVTFSLLPFMLSLTQYKTAKEEELLARGKNLNLFQRYRDVILIYTAFFSAIVLTYSILFTILPSSIAEKIFREQIEQIRLIRGQLFFTDKFLTIVLNNLGVLFLSFLLSLLFGAGAVFILTWNATILAAAVGMLAKEFGGIKALPYSFLIFFPHGSLEILAYFIGGIAGGVISTALMKRRKEMTIPIIIDSLKFLLIAIALIIIAAFIETFMLIQ